MAVDLMFDNIISCFFIFFIVNQSRSDHPLSTHSHSSPLSLPLSLARLLRFPLLSHIFVSPIPYYDHERRRAPCQFLITR